MTALVLARHGESEWNARGLLTGWGDPELTARGREQARAAGTDLAGRGIRPALVRTSTLRRARRTAALVLAVTGPPGVPVRAHCWLNERRLGALEGLDKPAVVARYGNAARRAWRDDPDAVPPPRAVDGRAAGAAAGPAGEPPGRPGCGPDGGAESRRQLAERVLAGWHRVLRADLRAGGDLLVVAHRGPLQVLAGHLGLPAAATARLLAPGGTLVLSGADVGLCCPLPRPDIEAEW